LLPPHFPPKGAMPPLLFNASTPNPSIKLPGRITSSCPRLSAIACLAGWFYHGRTQPTRRQAANPIRGLMRTMIECRHLEKVYPGDVVAVRDLNLSVAEGSITCLVGPSGCGKTTTLKMLNRLIEPTGGEIWINDIPVREQDPIELRRSIGYVIQRGGLMPHMTIRRNIALVEEARGRQSKEQRAARVDELLDLVGLAPQDYADRYPSELSGGQQQRVSIARALMSDPPVLLMDEPFSALDPITRNRLQKEFLHLNQKLNKTIVLVTHDLPEAFRLADEIVLMHEGELVQKGTKKDFLERPASDYASEFIKSQLPDT